MHLEEFIKKHYHPSRMVLVAAGGMDHEHVVELANKSFTRDDKYKGPGTPTFDRDNDFSEEMLPEYENFWKPVNFHSCEIRENYPSVGTVCGTVCFPTVGWSHKDSMTMMVLSQMIGTEYRYGLTNFNFGIQAYIRIATVHQLHLCRDCWRVFNHLTHR